MAALRALAELYGYFRWLVEERRSSLGDDMVSDLLRADAAGDGVGLEGILGYAFVMIAGGNDTATGLLAGSAELLAASPGERQRLVEHPPMIAGAIDELLRLTSPVQGLCRVAAPACSTWAGASPGCSPSRPGPTSAWARRPPGSRGGW